ncbi:hypothetical protein FS837_004300 [Tulasnella sp. UAMH 9824]|nr:hypothetical protein FS837_004300 [Tulasnella sp. UAMH 9824]
MVEQSVLKPVDASTLPDYEAEGKAPWIVRELAGSLTGRVMMASYETIKATGKSVVCLSPWGDSSPLLLPCIRFRDLVATTITLGKGGTAAIVAPAISSSADMVPGGSDAASFVTAQLVSSAGKEAVDNAVNWLLVDKPLDDLLRTHTHVLDGNSAKEILITLKYKHVTKDAALGFFRSPQHGDASILSKVADYFAVENGVVLYLPLCQRSTVAETLLSQSAFALHFCQPQAPSEQKTPTSVQGGVKADHQDAESQPAGSKPAGLKAQTKRLGKKLLNEGASSEVPAGGTESAGRQPAVQANAPPADADVDQSDLNPLVKASTSVPSRRMIILPLGIKPHRARAWTSSARPGESVMRYILFNGCPTVVVPVKPGSPLVAWDTLTLSQLDKYSREGRGEDGVVRILMEYVELCVDWERMVVPSKGRDELRREAIKDALTLLVENLVKAGQSQDVKEKIDADRAGIVFFRVP